MKMLTRVGCLVAVAVSVLSLIELAGAASDRCRVVRAEGNRLELECRQPTSDFPRDSGVKIKTDRSPAAIEGC